MGLGLGLKLQPRATLIKRVSAALSGVRMGSSKPSWIDVDRVRNDMVEDAMSVVHFNSAGDSPMPLPVLERVTKHMKCEAALGGYEAAAQCQDELESVYESAAQLINANADEIALQVRHITYFSLLQYFTTRKPYAQRKTSIIKGKRAPRESFALVGLNRSIVQLFRGHAGGIRGSTPLKPG